MADNNDNNVTDGIIPADKIGRSYEQIWRERSIRITKEPRKRITMYSQEANPHRDLADNALTGIHEKSLLSHLFFSPQNVQTIQNMIRYNIHKISKGKYTIDEQDPLELQIIMRSIYLQYSRNNYQDIKEQIQRLNEIIIEEITPKILANIQQYLTYLKDRSKPFYGNGPIERPVNVSSAGLKSMRIDTALGF